jgi:hypothetical protein
MTYVPVIEYKLSDLITKDIGVDNCGINAREIDNKVHFSFPIVVYIGEK